MIAKDKNGENVRKLGITKQLSIISNCETFNSDNTPNGFDF